MVQTLLTTTLGSEAAAAAEVGELGGWDLTESGAGFIIGNVPDVLTACKLAYQSQSITGAAIILGRAARGDDLLHTVKHVIDGIDWRPWLTPSHTFVIRCNKDDSFSSQELCADTGGFVLDRVNAKVDVKKPDVTILIHVTAKDVFICIDLCGSDLSKRSYRVFAGSDFLKGSTAYTLLRLAGYSSEKKLVDPFCRAGTIPIEAALSLAKRSPHFYDKEHFIFRRLPQLKETDWDATFAIWDDRPAVNGDIIAMDANLAHVMAAKKNAKIAGINKYIHFSRTDLSWLDAKFGKHALDLIVSVPVQASQRMEDDLVRKIYREFFYQAEFVLKKEGTIALLMLRGIDVLAAEAKPYGFAIVTQQSIWLGKEEWKLVTLRRT